MARSAYAHRLRVLFLGLAGTASATTLAACDAIEADDFETDACQGGELAGVTPAIPVDHLVIRSTGAASGETAFRVIEERGVACATATDKAKCQTALASLSPSNVRSLKAIDHFDGRYLAYTRGDEVGAIVSSEELRAFLAPFENPKDGALLLQQFTEHRVQCGGPNVRPSGDGFELYTSTGYACGKGTHRDDHIVRVARDGTTTLVETEVEENGSSNCAVGRRPEGYVASTSTSSVGDYLATAAELEAASVLAFRRLARELRAHGAPDDLVVRAKAAAKDEIRHARSTRLLAKRFGGDVKSSRVGELQVRSLDAIAEENAREGCVRETFGALVATVQATRALDPAVREEMSTIARDETEHAALAWDVAEWLDGVLDDAARAKTRRARSDAAIELRAALERSFTSPLLGLPDPAEAKALFIRMESELFALS